MLQKRNQLERRAGWTEQIALAAGLVESVEPAAKSARVAVPAGSRGLSQVFRRIGTEQLVRLHGHGGEAVAGAFEQGGKVAFAPCDLGPKRLLLRGVQQHAAVDGALFP